MSTTRLSQGGVGAAPYGVFAPKANASVGPHDPGVITRAGQCGVMSAKYGVFIAKTPADIVVSPTTPDSELRRPGAERMWGNWLWKYRDEEEEEAKVEEIQAEVVKKLKKVQKKAPDRNPAKQLSMLAGRTVEQHEAETSAQIAQSVVAEVSTTLMAREMTIGELLTQQDILYSLIRQKVRREAEIEARRRADEDDEEAITLLLM